MERALVAGATGYLGGFIVDELKKRGVWVRALIRRPEQRQALESRADDIVIGQVTDPSSLRGLANGVDACFSTIGITTQHDGLTYEDVDYRGNLNLLHEATASGAATFAYVSILHGQRMRAAKLVDAKERFVDALVRAPLSHRVIRPTGFFSDMTAILAMARNGVVILLGDGEARMNPISGRDLAAACVDATLGDREEIEVGGPAIYTQNEIAKLAFSVLQKRPRVWHIPMWSAHAARALLRAVTPVQLYGPIELFVTVGTTELVAPAYGTDTLAEFFRERAANIR